MNVAILAKAPIPGTVKTRLGQTLGMQYAALLARAFLLDVLHAFYTQSAQVRLYLDGDPATVPELSQFPKLQVRPQALGSLGARITQAVTRELSERPRVLIVGSDSPGMPPSLAAQAETLLNEHDLSFVPAEDGGFCLMGARAWRASLCEGIAWSCDQTLAQLKQRAQTAGLAVAQTASWFDIDTEDDLERLRNDLRSGKVVAPRTRDILEGRSG